MLIRLVCGATAVLGLALMSACGGASGSASLTITASPSSIPTDGTSTTLTISAKDASGNAGTGSVALTTHAGALNGSGTTASVTLSNGSGTATYACNKATDVTCGTSAGSSIAGTWGSASGSVTITLNNGSGPGPDGGSPGTDGGSPGTDAGSPALPSSDGGIPTNYGMSLSCNPQNLWVFDPNSPFPAPQTSTCTVTVVDREGHPVPSATVYLMTEAGAVPPSIQTDPTGTASFTFNSAAGTWPYDVPALAATGRPYYPYSPVAEPSWTDADAGVTHNPRDGLVTILAYTVGQEWFYDKNGNGRYDTGEPFVDQGEPFVDADDSNTWNLDEPFVDMNGNGIYDRPNGTWDGQTLVWTEGHVLYTGPIAQTNLFIDGPVFGTSCSTTGGIPAGGTDWFYITMHDANLNTPAKGTNVTANVDPSTLSVTTTIDPATILPMDDEFGFQLAWSLYDTSTGGECMLTGSTLSAKCVFQLAFGNWQQHQFVDGTMSAPTTPVTPSCGAASNATLRVTFTEPNWSNEWLAAGWVK